MEKAIKEIKINYKIGEKKFSSNSKENEHFKIETAFEKSHFLAKLYPKTTLEITYLGISFDYYFNYTNRIFSNGFQSWTDSKEYLPDEKQTKLPFLTKGLIKNTAWGRSGDYHIHKYPQKAGEFFSYSYTYIRNDENYFLLGSSSERNGFTIFSIKTKENKIIIEKDLQGVQISDAYTVCDIIFHMGTHNEVFDAYFKEMKIPQCKFGRKTGYTSWYNYYNEINENILMRDLEEISKISPKLDIFQIDDGYQSNIGDWLEADTDKFPNGMKKMADAIHRKNMLAGLWIAPFSCVKKSKLYSEHSDWLIKDKNNRPYMVGMNWGGFFALDIENKEARNYIKNYFDIILNVWNFDMVKLDFLYAACVLPNHNKSRGQLMCEAMDFVRECVGDKIILGCGVPLAPAFGKADFCRIGADMGLKWKKPAIDSREGVSTQNSLTNSIFRRGLNGKAFINDPDVFLLRNDNISLSFEQRKIIAKINSMFGGLLFTSDNVGIYNEEQKKTLKETLTEKDCQIISAENSKNIFKIRYLSEGQEKEFCFDMKRGGLIQEKERR